MLRFLSTLFSLLFITTIVWAEGDPKSLLLIRGDHNLPPYEFLNDNGIPSGFNIEMMQAVAKVMELEIEIRLGPWNEVRNDLEAGRIDALAGMYYSKERDRLVDFSTPYIIVSQAIFVRQNSPVQSFEDLWGKEIIVHKGDVMHDYAKSINLFSKIITVENQIDALKLLASGKHDGALLAKLHGHYLIRKIKLTNIKSVDHPIQTRKYCFAVEEGNIQLLALLNEGLSILRTTGQYEKIHQKWFGVYEQKSFFRKVFFYAAWTLIPLIVLLLSALTWTWILRRKIAFKTTELRLELDERRRAEEKLQESEERLFQIIQGNSIPTFVIDKDHMITNWNKACEKLTGVLADNMIGTKHQWMPFYPDQRPILADLMVDDAPEEQVALYYKGKYRKSTMFEGTFEAENFFPNLGEKGKWLFFTAIALRNNAGECIGAIETVQDFTKRRRAEEELKKHRDHLEELVDRRTGDLRRTNKELQREITERMRVEEVLREKEYIIESASSPISTTDLEGRMTYFNPEFKSVWRVEDTDSVLGNHFSEYLMVNGQLDSIMETLHTEGTWLGEIMARRLDGTLFDIQISAAMVFDKQGKPMALMSTSTDITDRKQAEAKLQQYADDQAVLLSEVNHRVKNNLSSIISMLHMEEDRAKSKNRSRYLLFLRDLDARIQGLSTVHSMLSESKWRPLELSLLCEQIIGEIVKGVPFSKSIDLNISGSSVLINSNQAHHLALVINELATNSMKYALYGRKATCILVGVEHDKSEVSICFRDDGPGYPDEIVNGDYSKTSIGFELICGIVTQSLNGKVLFHNDNGAVTKILFENEQDFDTMGSRNN